MRVTAASELDRAYGLMLARLNLLHNSMNMERSEGMVAAESVPASMANRLVHLRRSIMSIEY